MLVSYFQVINHIFETYAMKNEISGADTEIVRFTKPTIVSPFYANDLWRKGLRFSKAYNEHEPRGTPVEGLQSSIKLSMRLYLQAIISMLH